MKPTQTTSLFVGSFALACAAAPAASPERQCEEASRRAGALACVHRLTDTAVWQSVSRTMAAVDQVRSAKYLFPARDDARLLPLVMNSNRFELHYDFLVEAFGDLFPGLTPHMYLDLLFNPEEREYYAGALTEYRDASGQTELGFTIAGDPKAPGSIGCEDVRLVHSGLSQRLHQRRLAVVPSDRAQLDFIASCGVPVHDPNDVEYEVYHAATGCGTLRRYSASGLSAAADAAEFGFRDVLVLDQAPSDLDTVVSGAVTGTRQGPLSHLAVRSASRGTPNCYLKDASAYLEPWEGQLVCIECGARELLVRHATQSEAEAFWEQLRPPPVSIPEPDRDFSDLVLLDQVPVATPEDRALGTARFGAKGRNLAWLRQNMNLEFTPDGFLIPVAHYLRFAEQGSWQLDLGGGVATHSFAETLDAWLDDPAFRGDAKLRRDRLLRLQEAFRASACDPALLSALEARIVEVFGNTTTTVRFRSSSNAEDGAFFNGAGLYDSFSGCLGDDLDGDEVGPSRCDPHELDERGVCRALKKVWASLWNPRAYDERDFYGIDPRRAAMGVLVNERSDGERANMVAFDGNPVTARDGRYLVNAQFGELPVVSPEPGVWPEQALLEVEGGAVTAIERIASSSEALGGQQVLADTELRMMGEQLNQLSARYPFDAQAPAGHVFLLDTEWKLMPDGSLRIKQLRPFLK